MGVVVFVVVAYCIVISVVYCGVAWCSCNCSCSVVVVVVVVVVVESAIKKNKSHQKEI